MPDDTNFDEPSGHGIEVSEDPYVQALHGVVRALDRNRGYIKNVAGSTVRNEAVLDDIRLLLSKIKDAEEKKASAAEAEAKAKENILVLQMERSAEWDKRLTEAAVSVWKITKKVVGHPLVAAGIGALLSTIAGVIASKYGIEPSAVMP